MNAQNKLTLSPNLNIKSIILINQINKKQELLKVSRICQNQIESWNN